jgi:arylsulfatase A-like enzyme
VAPCYPTSEAEAIFARFGPSPAAATPDTARLAYATDVFLEHVFPRYQPRVTILWFSDPDKTYHYCGIGSEASLRAIQAADTLLGRIMDWLQQPAQRERFNLLVLSDHGHVTVRQQVSVREALTAIGVSAGNGFYSDQGVAVVPSYTGAIHVRNSDPQLVRKIATWMQEQPWCGALFTSGKNAVEGCVPGTFARSLVLNEHARTGDIVYTMRTDEAQNEHGFVGNCYDDSALPIGGSTHGGLSPYELRNVCAAYGPAFREGHASTVPSGTIDVLPTLLHLLGYNIPPRVEGRVLTEALGQTSAAPGEAPVTQTYSTEAVTPSGVYRQHLTFTRVGATTYLERGGVE